MLWMKQSWCVLSGIESSLKFQQIYWIFQDIRVFWCLLRGFSTTSTAKPTSAHLLIQQLLRNSETWCWIWSILLKRQRKRNLSPSKEVRSGRMQRICQQQPTNHTISSWERRGCFGLQCSKACVRRRGERKAVWRNGFLAFLWYTSCRLPTGTVTW